MKFACSDLFDNAVSFCYEIAKPDNFNFFTAETVTITFSNGSHIVNRYFLGSEQCQKFMLDAFEYYKERGVKTEFVDGILKVIK